mmetsp:Transcript_12298/g.34675  ORF Transcript_12298/g.34675 Transcript_12298/m.34675 type:complete len:524 (+) Transcript_12298:125-1696(+)|eukprot:CAMPEP_0119131598 /NCGR_PEP_ID=MMETSP1310-20130426/10472_1 /TAXON_ID=464262 /ORGANISM="Genus nov. species nov., Strain RCC2339" /LENGTH=523 /DNA_ID=CAMNT_0007122183 /DNA_START=51 /DNA_END=1622 /DNA_ORIENTATION=+
MEKNDKWRFCIAALLLAIFCAETRGTVCPEGQILVKLFSLPGCSNIVDSYCLSNGGCARVSSGSTDSFSVSCSSLSSSATWTLSYFSGLSCSNRLFGGGGNSGGCANADDDSARVYCDGTDEAVPSPTPVPVAPGGDVCTTQDVFNIVSRVQTCVTDLQDPCTCMKGLLSEIEDGGCCTELTQQDENALVNGCNAVPNCGGCTFCNSVPSSPPPSPPSSPTPPSPSVAVFYDMVICYTADTCEDAALQATLAGASSATVQLLDNVCDVLDGYCSLLQSFGRDENTRGQTQGRSVRARFSNFASESEAADSRAALQSSINQGLIIQGNAGTVDAADESDRSNNNGACGSCSVTSPYNVYYASISEDCEDLADCGVSGIDLDYDYSVEFQPNTNTENNDLTVRSRIRFTGAGIALTTCTAVIDGTYSFYPFVDNCGLDYAISAQASSCDFDCSPVNPQGVADIEGLMCDSVNQLVPNGYDNDIDFNSNCQTVNINGVTLTFSGSSTVTVPFAIICSVFFSLFLSH